jgi:hypothetical protein
MRAVEFSGISKGLLTVTSLAARSWCNRLHPSPFHTDSVALSYSNVEAAKQWWIDTFGCKMLRVPQE